MTAQEIRQTFLDFFKSKGHHIVSSAPIVVKGDPTLMSTTLEIGLIHACVKA